MTDVCVGGRGGVDPVTPTIDPSSPPQTRSKKIDVLITAHPDDESLFFVPTLYGLWQHRKQQEEQQQDPNGHLMVRGSLQSQQENHWCCLDDDDDEKTDLREIWLMCLTTGNYDGLGNIRQKELERVCFGSNKNEDKHEGLGEFGNKNNKTILPMIDKLLILRGEDIVDKENKEGNEYRMAAQEGLFLLNNTHNNNNNNSRNITTTTSQTQQQRPAECSFPLDHPAKSWNVASVAKCIQQALEEALSLSDGNDDGCGNNTMEDDSSPSCNDSSNTTTTTTQNDENKNHEEQTRDLTNERSRNPRSALTTTTQTTTKIRTTMRRMTPTAVAELQLYTFDRGGVSGHVNHRDTFLAVQHLFLKQQQQDQQQVTPAVCDTINTNDDDNNKNTMTTAIAMMIPKDTSESHTTTTTTMSHPRHNHDHPYPFRLTHLWTLETEYNVLAKYLPLYSWLLLLCTWLGLISSWSGCKTRNETVILFRLQQPWQWNWRAMATHESQFVWYRRLFVMFCSYTYVNVLHNTSSAICGAPPSHHSSKEEAFVEQEEADLMNDSNKKKKESHLDVHVCVQNQPPLTQPLGGGTGEQESFLVYEKSVLRYWSSSLPLVILERRPLPRLRRQKRKQAVGKMAGAAITTIPTLENSDNKLKEI